MLSKLLGEPYWNELHDLLNDYDIAQKSPDVYNEIRGFLRAYEFFLKYGNDLEMIPYLTVVQNILKKEGVEVFYTEAVSMLYSERSRYGHHDGRWTLDEFHQYRSEENGAIESWLQGVKNIQEIIEMKIFFEMMNEEAWNDR